MNLYGMDMAEVNLAGDDTAWTDERMLPASLYVVGAGDVKVITAAGSTRTVPVGANGFLPVRVRKVFNTANGTTATGVWAIFA